MKRVRQPHLVSDGQRQPLELVIFVAAPQTHGRDHTPGIAALTRACQRFGHSSGIPIRVLSGASAGGLTAPELGAWMRSSFVRDVDALIEIYGPSWGCGREEELASELHIPRLLAVPEGQGRSAVAGSDGRGLFAEGKFRSLGELDQLAYEWLCSFREAVENRHSRRTTPPRLADGFRAPSARAWQLLDDVEQREISSELGMRASEIQQLVLSADEYAEAHLDVVLWLAQRLGVWDDEQKTIVASSDLTSGYLSAREVSSYEQAKSRHGWNEAVASAVFTRGIELAKARHAGLEAGIAFRSSLASIAGWTRIWKDL